MLYFTGGNTVKPRYIATIGKREFWWYNEFGDRSRFEILSDKCVLFEKCILFTNISKYISALLNIILYSCVIWAYSLFNPLPHRDAFNAFANRADPDHAALVRAALSGSTLFSIEI